LSKGGGRVGRWDRERRSEESDGGSFSSRFHFLSTDGPDWTGLDWNAKVPDQTRQDQTRPDTTHISYRIVSYRIVSYHIISSHIIGPAYHIYIYIYIYSRRLSLITKDKADEDVSVPSHSSLPFPLRTVLYCTLLHSSFF
jgi:hypothetical protein